MYTTKIVYSRCKFCKKQLFLYTPLKQLILGANFVKNNFFYIHYTILLLYYTYWKCLNRRLSPETQSATLKFELWEAGMTLEYVLVVVAIISCIASVIGTVYAALTYHKKKQSKKIGQLVKINSPHFCQKLQHFLYIMAGVFPP